LKWRRQLPNLATDAFLVMPLDGRASSLVRPLRRRNSSARVAVTLFALLVFAFQTYVVQTHIHLSPQAIGSVTVGAKAPALDAQKQQPDKFPARDDPANCPICQELLHSGQFVTPSAVATLLPSLLVSVIAIVIHIAVAPEATSHTWQSRGPPRN